MSYVRIDYKRNYKFVSDNYLTESINKDRGVVLIVTGRSERSNSLYDYLKNNTDLLTYDNANRNIKTRQGIVQIDSIFDFRCYMGLQLSSAYIHGDANLDFLCQIASKCILDPATVGY